MSLGALSADSTFEPSAIGDLGIRGAMGSCIIESHT